MKLIGDAALLLNHLSEEVKKQIPSDVIILTLKELSQTNRSEKFLVLSDNLSNSELIQNMLQNNCDGFLQTSHPFFEKELTALAHTISHGQKKIFEFHDFLLSSSDLDSLELSFSKPDHKIELREKTTQYLSDKVRESVIETTLAILEELFMNAIYDAPRENKRSQNLYESGHQSHLKITVQSDRALITCVDPYGSLLVEKVIHRIKQVYEQGAAGAMNFGEGGAGLGCYILVENSASLYMFVNKDMMTSVTCVIPTKMSNVQKSKIFKNIYLKTF